MCLAVSAKIIEIQDALATVELRGVRRSVSLMLLPEAKVGDYVLVHAGFAMQVVGEADAAEREAYIAWLSDFEYDKLGLPRPDGVIFLDMAPAVSDRLLTARAKAEGRGDIHETDRAYLHRCHEAYRKIAARFGWHRILCIVDDAPRPAEDIAAEVYAAAMAVIEGKAT